MVNRLGENLGISRESLLEEFSGEERSMFERAAKGDIDNDPELKAELVAWIVGLEKKAEEDPSSRTKIEITLRQAKMHFLTGNMEYAWENVENALDQAMQDGEMDMYDQGEALLDFFEEEVVRTGKI